MPSPLGRIAITNPGASGLFTQKAVETDDPQALRVAINCVFDANNRIAARKGFNALTSSPMTGTPDVEQVFEAEVDKDTRHILSTATVSAAQEIYKGTTTLTSIVGSLTPTANNWKFQNFNGKVVGVQQGEEIISWDGTGNFATIQSGLTAWQATTAYSVDDIVIAVSGNTNLQFVVTTGGTSAGSEPTWNTADQGNTTDNDITWKTIVMPKGNDCVAAFGRVWAFSEDGTLLKYSGLLDETDWGSTSAGFVTLDHYWGNHADFGVAVAEFNNVLVVFGYHSILLLTSADDPTNLAINDTIDGVGCIERDSVQNIGTDLLFLDNTGLRSFLRSLELKSQALREVSKNVRDDFLTSVGAATSGTIRSVYNPKDGFYLIKAGSDFWYFDTKESREDLSARVLKWAGLPATSMCWCPRDEVVYWGGAGVIANYTTYLDNGNTYQFRIESVYLDYNTNNLKILKRALYKLIGGSSYTVTAQWKVDFDDSKSDTYPCSLPGRTVAEWGIAEWGMGEWTGGEDLALNNCVVPLTQTGQHFSIGLFTNINGTALAVREIVVLIKQGRLDL